MPTFVKGRVYLLEQAIEEASRSCQCWLINVRVCVCELEGKMILKVSITNK